MFLNESKFLTATIVGLAVLFTTITSILAQGNYNYYAEKPGSCPPPLPVEICTRGCYVDAHCQGIGKCCPTSCGGSICSRPVTMKAQPVVKPGYCPAIPTGRWVCTPTCSSDGDCTGVRKCCKNRCGAMACQKPQYDSAVPSDERSIDQPSFNPYLVYMN